MKFTAFTDGACSNNQHADKRVGGWAYVVFRRNENGQLEKAESSNHVAGATNNQMELLSVIEALKFILKSAGKNVKPEVVIHSDSQYVVDSIEGKSLETWKNNGWRTQGRTPVKNQDMWLELDSLLKEFSYKFEKVVGDGSVKWNDHCDVMARTACGSKPKRK